VRTQSILALYLPAPPATIYDIGGGAGVYAFPLAKQGYAVHLVDASPLHVDQARQHAAENGIALSSIAEGDARQLGFADKSADAVLLLGPLYHLTEPADRLSALAEARRVLKPGGVLFAAAVSRFASLIDGLTWGHFLSAEFREIASADLTTGQHRNPTSHPEYFTTAYFHRPQELADEVSHAGFEQIRVLAVEGPAWSAPKFREVWSDLRARSDLLEFLARIDDEPSVLGASAHFVAVARRV
jgi:ubiquinone/menaquinone biosynthesis C-methylase UbiE